MIKVTVALSSAALLLPLTPPSAVKEEHMLPHITERLVYAFLSRLFFDVNDKMAVYVCVYVCVCVCAT